MYYQRPMCKLPHEIVHLIIGYVEDLSDFLNMRLCSKQFSIDCLQYWHTLEPELRVPRATMIPINECMFCSEKGNMKQTQLMKDSLPRRIFIHCNRVKCCHACVQSMKQIICQVDECRIVQNWRHFLPKTILIKRSSGKIQEATPLPFYLFLLNNKTYVRADFHDNNMDCCKLVAYEPYKIQEPKLIVF